MMMKQQVPSPARLYNAATRAIASTLGVLVGIGSIDHGLLECLQGFRPTPGLIVNALGSGYRWTAWTQGGEGAFTLVPNFLVTGILATLLGLLMILWSLRYIQTPYGPAVFLLLGVASFLTGGGVAQVVLFTLTWGVATRIRASLASWRWLIPASVRPALGCLWPWTLGAATVLFLSALEIAIFGYVPGVTEQTRLLHICWSILAFALALYLLAILSGFARDIETRDRTERG
ncbi:MAG TPA: hypothetical protein VKG86_07865 [Terracidiphilus sp.]|nr:hypothetical protein [Terracidiphilus sp.]